MAKHMALKGLLILITILITGCTLAQDPNEDTMIPLTEIYLLRDTISYQQIYLDASGFFQSVNFYRGKIFEFRTDILSKTGCAEIIKVIQENDFWGLQETYRLAPDSNIVYENMTSTLKVKKNLQSKTVVADEYVAPKNFLSIVNALLLLTTNVDVKKDYEYALRATPLDKILIKGKWENEAQILRNRGFKFHQYAENDSINIPSLKWALNHPLLFAPLGSEEFLLVTKISDDPHLFYIHFNETDFKVETFEKYNSQ